LTLLLHLVRHAHYPLAGRALGGRSGHSLSLQGRAQAEALAERLAAPPLAAVYTSPNARARETAAPLAARHGLEPRPAPALDELDYGAWTGRPFAELAGDPVWRRYNAARSLTRIPGGETMAEAQARLVGFVEWAREAYPDAAVAAVGHADPLRALLCFLLGLPLDLFGRIELEPAGVAVVAIDPWGTRLLALYPAPACPAEAR
jgi:probable phosphoglycerate mutase